MFECVRVCVYIYIYDIHVYIMIYIVCIYMIYIYECGEHDVVKMMRESRDADVKSAANTFYFLSGES